jgi:hypothetical protein
MVSRIEDDPEGMYSYIKNITHILTMTPVPLAGRIDQSLVQIGPVASEELIKM